ncbi:MAG: YfiR family protein [Deltaproteobacteria bacterium]|nr:YfiR family protein [Deltaproteobacteria bacterium]
MSRFALPTTFVAVAVAILLPRVAVAESAEQVKAAFLFNFARYVEWPESAFASAEAPIRICLIGGAGFAEVLTSAVSGRTVGARPVEVAPLESLDGAAECHLLFFEEAAVAQGAAVAERLGTLAVFTISDRSGFAREGGVANFILVDQKIRFEINQRAARRAGLKISSSLLRLAKLVDEGGH